MRFGIFDHLDDSGLRVVDASLFPAVPCANTNFPTLMTAEKISDTMVAA